LLARYHKFVRNAISLLPLPVVLLVVTGVFYGAALNNGFLATWDDNAYVTGNQPIKAVTWDHIVTVFSSFYVGNYAPLHLLSYMVDHALWGLNPAGFIATNMLLHALNGILLFRLAQSLGLSRGWAFLGAGFFLIHPVQVESVVWVSQRKTVLAMTFYLGAWTWYLAYLRAAGRQRTYAYLMVMALFTAAVLTKAVVVVFPLALIAVDDFWLQRASWRQILVDKIPLFIIAGAGIMLALASQAEEAGGGRIELPAAHPLGMLFTMVTVFARYLGMLIWPVNLSAHYQIAIRNEFDGAVAVGMMVLGVTAGVLFLLWRRDRRMFSAALLFLIGLLPVSHLVPFTSLMHDRYLYFPLLGAALALGLGAAHLADRRSQPWAGVLLVTGGIWLLVLPGLGVQRIPVWHNDLTLWQDAVAKDPGDVFAWTELGAAYHKAGAYGQALVPYERALALSPTNRPTLTNMALAQMRLGNYSVARGYLQQQVRYHPAYAKGYEDIALTYRLEGDLAAAERMYRQALQLDSRLTSSLLALAQVLLHRGELDAARAQLARAQDLRAPAADIAFGLACLAAQEGQLTAALVQVRAALREGKAKAAIMNEPLLAPVRTLPAFLQMW